MQDIKLSEIIAPSFFDVHRSLKKIKGFGGRYYISNDGKVYSTYNNELKEIKSFESHNGYLRVSLNYKGKGKKYFVHRLVATYFVKNKDNYDSVDHIDKNVKNNNYTNLRWTSKSYNMGSNNSKLNRTQVQYIKKNYKRGNGQELSKRFNIDLSMVVKIAKGKAYNWIDER